MKTDSPIESVASAVAETHNACPAAEPFIARAMPWILSSCFHLGIVLLAVLLVMVVDKGPLKVDAAAPNFSVASNGIDGDPGASNGGGGGLNIYQEDSALRKPTVVDRTVLSTLPPPTIVAPDMGGKRSDADVIGLPQEGGILMAASSGNSIFDQANSAIGRPGSGGGTGGGNGTGDGPGDGVGVGFGPPGRPPVQAVFVIDGSGSMVENFDRLAEEMTRFISKLSISRDGKYVDSFQVIFFTSGKPREIATGNLLQATTANKSEAAKFLDSVTVGGSTDPVPALTRALDILQKADDKSAKVVYLLSDGVFPDEELVLDTVARLNANKKVQIFTYLYGHRPERAEVLMKRIAKENRGKYNYVNPED